MLRRALRLSLFLLFALASAAQAQEVIRMFQSDIRIGADGTLDVREAITVTAEGDAIKHGIYRDFPRYFVKADGTLGEVSFDVKAVTRDGTPEPFTTQAVDGGTRIRIGNADETVQPGVHTYRIDYQTDRQIRFDKGHDTLVWNVTGTGWRFPIETARANVSLPNGARALSAKAYTGAKGETGRDATAQISGNHVEFQTTRPLQLGEGVTIEASFPKGVVLAPTDAQTRAWWWRDNLGAVIAYGGLAGVFALFFALWFARGRDPKSGVVVARWDLPKGVSPALASYIDESGLSGGAWSALSASAIDLAVNGYVTLDNLDQAVTITRTSKPLPDDLPAGQVVLIETVERYGGAFTIKRANGEAVQTMSTAFRTAIETENRGVFFQRNGGAFVLGLLASVSIALIWCLTSGLSSDRISAMAMSGVVPLLLGVLIWRALKARRRRVMASARLFFTVAVILLGMVGGFAFLIAINSFADVLGAKAALTMLWGLVAINLLFFVLLLVPTKRGRDIRDHIAGLRLYLTLAEKDRMNLAGAPQMSPAHFETLLPYAIVLGVEKRWSKSFETWLSAAVAGTAAAYAPDWYRGARSGNVTRDIASFASNMGSSMAASVPSSDSSGSGSSGSGGGGGGGGGW